MNDRAIIQSLLTAANAVTGAADGNLTDAIRHLKSGYGGLPGMSRPDTGVCFYDYDGRIVETWTAEEAAGKTALPPNPDHSADIRWAGQTIPLTALGWNRSLADLKNSACAAQTQNAGQLYRTADNALYLCVSLTAPRLSPAVRFDFTGGGCGIDWGDGSECTAAVSGTDNLHTYARGGDYLIRILPEAGTEITLSGDSAAGARIFHKPGGAGNENHVYLKAVRKVFLPANVRTISGYAFGRCYGLQEIAMPSGIAVGGSAFAYCYSLRHINLSGDAGNYAFNSCNALRSITFPEHAGSPGMSVFNNCSSLDDVCLPAGVTELSASLFNNCYSLSMLVIPPEVTAIGASAICNCYGLGVILFAGASPPAAANSNAFSNLPKDCVLCVPLAGLNAYKTATNYPSAASYTYFGY